MEANENTTEKKEREREKERWGGEQRDSLRKRRMGSRENRIVLGRLLLLPIAYYLFEY